MAGKLLLVHGGGPTAVMNCSLYGAAEEAIASGKIDEVYGAIGGMGGLLAERFVRLDTLPSSRRELLRTTPGSAIGTSRDAMEAPEYARAAEVIRKNGFNFLLCNGGNGTMDTCGKVYEACQAAGTQVLVAGIPKTMDNDIAVTDHSPGFPSAARRNGAGNLCRRPFLAPPRLCGRGHGAQRRLGHCRGSPGQPDRGDWPRPYLPAGTGL